MPTEQEAFEERKAKAKRWDAAGRPGSLREFEYDKSKGKYITDDQRAKELKDYVGNVSKTAAAGKVPLSSDEDIARGQAVGLARANQLYGISTPELGRETAGVRERAKSRMEGASPEDTALRNQRNAMERRMRAAGKSEGEIEQSRRRADMDISGSIYNRKLGAEKDYSRLIGNMIGGTTSLEMGMAQLQKSGEDTDIQPYKGSSGMGGMFGTVICTELHKRGYLSDEIYAKDFEYGYMVRRSDPAVYIGYRFLADPIVAVMKKSPSFTWVVSLIAVPWAKNMAGNKNMFGSAVNAVGTALCRIVGKELTTRRVYENQN